MTKIQINERNNIKWYNIKKKRKYITSRLNKILNKLKENEKIKQNKKIKWNII